MNIGIDLDGVVYDSERLFRTYAEFFDVEIKGGGVVKSDEVRVQKRYNWPEGAFDKFLNSCLLKIEKQACLMPFVKECMIKLKEMGHKLIIISSRGCNDKKEEQIAIKRIKKDKLPIDKICFGQFSKLKACREEQIDIMIDDYDVIVKELADNNIHCLYFKDGGIKKVEHKNIEMVRSWGEVYKKFLEYKEN